MLLAVVLWLVSQPALGNSVCVTCDGPIGVYSCSYAPDANGHRPSSSGRALQFACIQDVARLYKHASCSVRRNQVDGCNGQVHMISQAPPEAPASLPGRKAATVNEQPAQPAATANEPAEAAAAPGKKPREPKTVVEMAKRTAKNTKKQIDKSAQTVTKAARSTWRCVSTLFAKC